ncbi:glycosyltransferase family 4 protein [Meridianimarinicoccus sp. RP-17]|uniref:glycosyltransferase family 4 protein n=1 Tax=Meridianimarinicoccus zhengii TaxID=2056810 RepID=UPI001F2D616F|nr:glycosyltransferase family 4 protein [Phycocomes zhengii]
MLTHRFFWPDAAPYATFLRVMADSLARAGHDVKVFASIPSYNNSVDSVPRLETLGSVQVTRSLVFRQEKRSTLLRLANVAIYCSQLFVHILRSRPDVVTASTYPPTVAALTTGLAARLVGARFLYHVQDIHPEVSKLSGSKLGGFPLFDILRWLDTCALRLAWRIVTLSDDMAATLRARSGRLAGRIRIINNLSLDDGKTTKPAAPQTDRFRVIFAGNLGRYQNLPLVAAGVARLFDRHPGLELMFLGSGVMERELRAIWGDHPRITFHPFVPFEEARAIIQASQLGIVSIVPGLAAVAYPSKIMTYQSLALPILGLVDPDSHIARDLEASGAGVVVRDRSESGVAEALERAITSTTLHAAARNLASRYEADTILAEWEHLMAEAR